MQSLSLDGAWQFRRQGSEEFHPAQVPGCVHTDLQRNGLIPDPLCRHRFPRVFLSRSGRLLPFAALFRLAQLAFEEIVEEGPQRGDRCQLPDDR